MLLDILEKKLHVVVLLDIKFIKVLLKTITQILKIHIKHSSNHMRRTFDKRDGTRTNIQQLCCAKVVQRLLVLLDGR